MRLNKILPANFLLVAILVLSCSFVRCQADNNQELESMIYWFLSQPIIFSTIYRNPLFSGELKFGGLK